LNPPIDGIAKRKCYENDAVDFLLKPILFERLKRAVEKIESI
jgi:hypothetical protein